MPEITFAQAKEFLDNITSGDKVAIVHHGDLDGYASGICFYDWCEQNGAKAEHFTYFIGPSSLDDYPLEKFNKIIITDVAPNLIAEDLDTIKEKQVFYTDHHKKEEKIPEEILELRTTDDGYIPSSRTAWELTGIKKWLAVAGTVADAGDLYPENEKFIDNFLKEVDITLDKFKETVTGIISNSLIYFGKDSDKAFEAIQNIGTLDDIRQLEKYSEPVEDEIQRFVEDYEEKKERIGDINYYYFEPEFKIKSAVGSIIHRNNPDEVQLFASPYDNGKMLSISLRNQSKKRNMSELGKAGIAGLEKATAGGHVPAAGAKIQAKDLDKFKKNIREFLENGKSG